VRFIPSQKGFDGRKCLLDWVEIRRIRREIDQTGTFRNIEVNSKILSADLTALCFNKMTYRFVVMNCAVIQNNNTPLSRIWIKLWGL
jgi:hypothetical protein